MKKIAEGAQKPPTALEQNAEETLNDIGNARRLETAFADTLAYVRGAGWRYWTGSRWKGDDNAALNSAKSIAGALYDAAMKEQDEAKRLRPGKCAQQTAQLPRLA